MRRTRHYSLRSRAGAPRNAMRAARAPTQKVQTLHLLADCRVPVIVAHIPGTSREPLGRGGALAGMAPAWQPYVLESPRRTAPEAMRGCAFEGTLGQKELA
jgi:hypothetical protein